jgi:hypothetical protein
MARSWPSALRDDCFGLTLSVVRMAGGGADGNSAAPPASCDGIDVEKTAAKVVSLFQIKRAERILAPCLRPAVSRHLGPSKNTTRGVSSSATGMVRHSPISISRMSPGAE